MVEPLRDALYRYEELKLVEDAKKEEVTDC